MKLFRKAKDERVVAEVNRVYKIGFYVLTFGILADLVLQMSGFDMQVDVLRGANPTSFNLLEFAILMLAQLVCIALMARKGLMDDNAYAEADRYPWKHYLVQGVLAGVAAAVVVCAVQYGSGAVWASMGLRDILLVVAVQLLFLVPVTTVLVLLLTDVSFRYAAQRRRKKAEQMEDDGE